MKGAGIVAVEGPARAGAVVYWSLRGTLEVSALADAWAAAELPEELLLGAPTPDAALSRAVRTLATPRTLVRPLEKRKGYAVVREHAVGDDVKHNAVLSVRLDAAGRPEFHVPGQTNWITLRDTFSSAEALKMASAVQAAYDCALGECAAEDVGGWLAWLALRRLDGVGLRDAGGFYYLPPGQVPVWEKMRLAVKAVSAHKLQQIDAMRTDDVVDAVLDAVEAEAAATVERTFAELAEDMGKRALQTRVERAERVLAKVGRYEGLLGVRLDKIRERVGACQAAVSAALLRAEAETVAA